MTKATPVTELTSQELKRRLDHLAPKVWQMRLELHKRTMQKRYEGKEHLLKSFTVHTDFYRAFEVQALDKDDVEHLCEWYDVDFWTKLIPHGKSSTLKGMKRPRPRRNSLHNTEGRVYPPPSN
jgi:cytolysin (calcineurin-like family phosphatase)